MAGRLIIICGLPGSGKTTHAKSLEQSLGAVRLGADEWMDALGFNLWDESARGKMEALQWTVGQRLISVGQTVVIEWGTWGKSERDELRNAARNLGAKVELHYLHAPVDMLFERTQRRGKERPRIKREQIEKWTEIFQEPTHAEAELYDQFYRYESADLER